MEEMNLIVTIEGFSYLFSYVFFYFWVLKNIIKGNIASGKTTLCKELENKFGYKAFYEPTTTNPFLMEFYQDPKKYAFRMQIWLLKQRFKTYNQVLISMKKTKGVNVSILDRSLFSDYAFAKLNMLKNNITQQEFNKYLELRKKMIDSLLIPNYIIYLKVSVEECHKRIHYLRKRKEEMMNGISLDYLEGVESCYDELLDQLKKEGINIIIIDWNNFGNLKEIIETINNKNTLSDKKINWEFNHSLFLEIQRFSINSEWDDDYKELENIKIN